MQGAFTLFVLCANYSSEHLLWRGAWKGRDRRGLERPESSAPLPPGTDLRGKIELPCCFTQLAAEEKLYLNLGLIFFFNVNLNILGSIKVSNNN